MDISICFADFPTEPIADTTRRFRQLGIGYANLGALLMATGHAYDSEGGRALAAAITSLMTGAAYKRSAELAGVVGPYDGYARNAEPHQRVMRKHAAANDDVRTFPASAEIHRLATVAWREALAIGERQRLAQRAGLGTGPDRLPHGRHAGHDRPWAHAARRDRRRLRRPLAGPGHDGVHRRRSAARDEVLRQRRGADPAHRHRGRLHHPGHARPPHQGRRRRDRRVGVAADGGRRARRHGADADGHPRRRAAAGAAPGARPGVLHRATPGSRSRTSSTPTSPSLSATSWATAACTPRACGSASPTPTSTSSSG